MSLAHAILGFLRRQPQTGYQLKNEHFDKSVAYFWPADQTQIYKTLDKLVENGFATCAVELQTDRPNKKVYSISKAGKVEIERWLCEPIAPPADRDPLLVQIFFSSYVKSKEIVEILESARANYEEQLEDLRSIAIPTAPKCSSREQLGARLTLDLGLQSKQSYLDWINQAIATIKAFEAKTKR